MIIRDVKLELFPLNFDNPILTHNRIDSRQSRHEYVGGGWSLSSAASDSLRNRTL